MSETPPPLPNARDTWFTRNWKWFIPVTCLAGVGILAAFAALIIVFFGIIKQSDAYSGALARVRAAPAVVEAIGTPIQEGWFLTGSIRVSGGSGAADLAIPISGPKGKATVYVEASKVLGVWHFYGLIVEIQSTKDRIDLSEKRPDEALEPTRTSVTDRADAFCWPAERRPAAWLIGDVGGKDRRFDDVEIT